MTDTSQALHQLRPVFCGASAPVPPGLPRHHGRPTSLASVIQPPTGTFRCGRINCSAIRTNSNQLACSSGCPSIASAPARRARHCNDDSGLLSLQGRAVPVTITGRHRTDQRSFSPAVRSSHRPSFNVSGVFTDGHPRSAPTSSHFQQRRYIDQLHSGTFTRRAQ